jgi:hypothetical protein
VGDRERERGVHAGTSTRAGEELRGVGRFSPTSPAGTSLVDLDEDRAARYQRPMLNALGGLAR